MNTHEVRAELGPLTSPEPCPPRLRDIFLVLACDAIDTSQEEAWCITRTVLMRVGNLVAKQAGT